jgi:teichuronic acid biosynthesis glycosyltransferase TuaC
VGIREKAHGRTLARDDDCDKVPGCRGGSTGEEPRGLRIAFVATSYPRSVDDPSGHFVRAEAKNAVERGHEVHVLAPAPVGDEGLSAHAVGGDWLFRWPGAAARFVQNPLRIAAVPRFWAGVSRKLAEIQADRVVAHWLIPSAFPLLCADEIVCHGADVRLLGALPREVRAAIVERTLARAVHVRFVATSLRETLLAGLPDPLARRLLEQSTVEPPAVDVSDRCLREPLPARYVLGAGRLVRDKRFAWAIHAAHEAEVPLWLCGDGPEEPALRALATRLGAHVRFSGRLSRRETLGLLSGARALVHPSAKEAAPTVVLEARALGVPVVATAAGDIARWAEHDDGVRVGRDPAELARLLRPFVRLAR